MVVNELDEQAIFEVARQITSADAREAYLQQVCGEDGPLGRRVSALLRAHAESQSFLEAPPPGLALEQTTDQSPEKPGTLIGPYKLLEQIGEGGMGLVYMAEQQQPVRRLVALKLVKPGMDTKQVIARFEAERQALAMMDHPNIARIYDAGTVESSRHTPCAVAGDDGTRSVPATLGRPYFVMELVRGIPINDFCDQQKLTVRQRLELFIQVCQAVQHAHQKGIIHRDLKPTNVLVAKADTVPLPKVIDFGIAKALGPSLTNHTLHTGFAQLVGTPMYMSPEQAEMNQLGVDTRSDVYSLGVLLYELLTGTTPFDKDRLKNAGFDEMRRIIREEEPETVSARIARTKSSPLAPREEPSGHGTRSVPATYQSAPRLSELDWIVMKALEKDRSRRYESASALAADIQRYLSDEPVLACPPTTMYRFQKFARKHRPALATAAAIAGCLVLGTTVSAWQAVRATTAEAQANANEQKAVANAAQAQQKEQEAIQQRDEVKVLNDKLLATQQELQSTLYAAHMNLAHHAWDGGAINRAKDLLDQHRPKAGQPDHHGFEWHYLNRLCNGELLTFKGDAWSSVFSPDGKRVASISGDGTVKIWDAATGQEYLSLAGSPNESHRLPRVAFTPDGRRLATGAGRRTIKVWDAQTGQELLSMESPGLINGVAYSPDRRRLAHTSGQEVKIRDAQTGEELLTLKGHTGQVQDVAFSPDGRQLAAFCAGQSGDQFPRGRVKVWDSQTGQELLSLPGLDDGNHSYGLIAFSPDGQRLASPGGKDAVKIWDAKTGGELRTLQAADTGFVGGLAFSVSGELAVGTFDGIIRVWDVENGIELRAFKGLAPRHSSFQQVAYSPDGKRLAVTCLQVKLCDPRSSQEYQTIEKAGASFSAGTGAFSPDGKRLVGISGRDVKVWDAQTREELRTLKGHSVAPQSVAFSPDGKWLASGAGNSSRDGFLESEVKMWDAGTGEELHAFKEERGGPVGAVAFSPDSRILAAAYASQMVKLWDVAAGRELHTLRHGSFPNWIAAVAFSPDGKRVATACDHDGTIRIWDVQTGQELSQLKTKQNAGSALAVAFSPDGKRLASGHGSSSIRLWDAQSGEELLLLKGHATNVNAVAFSPDGKRLASASGDRTIKLWDTQTAKELLTLRGTRDPWGVPLAGLAFSPDGNRVVSTGDNKIKIWDATPLAEKP